MISTASHPPISYPPTTYPPPTHPPTHPLFTPPPSPHPHHHRQSTREVNAGGLEGLYEILLDTAKPEWVASLQRMLVAAEQGKPVLFFCKAGKDRTVSAAVTSADACVMCV